MRAKVRRILCVGAVAGMIGFAPAYSQSESTATPVAGAKAGQPSLGNRQPARILHPDRAAESSPSARYSPLAAQGGYRGQQRTWYDAMFRSLNPGNIDWGMSWERRRSVFLENSVGNKYFVYTAGLSLFLIYSVVVIIWQRWNHIERLRALADRTADAMNYATYWKERAGEATRKHNTHIERCNRVIEAGDGSVRMGDAGETADLRLELERMRGELANAQSDKKRLEAELEQKAALVADFAVRVDEATRRVGAGTGRGIGNGTSLKADDKAPLVERINRLEAALAAAKDENRRLRGA